MGRSGEVAGAANLVLVSGAAMLRPDVQVFDSMLEGWSQQRMSRNLARRRSRRGRIVPRFQSHTGEFPWGWLPAHLEEWTADLRRCVEARWVRRCGRIRTRCGCSCLCLRPGVRVGPGVRGTGSGRIQPRSAAR